jgi:hypothetical protein
MKTKTHFAFRIDVWDGATDNLVEHLAGLDNYAMAVAAYSAAVESRPKDKITLYPRRSEELVGRSLTGIRR